MTDLPQLTQALKRTKRAGGHRVLYRFTLDAGGRTHEFDSVLAAEGEPPWTLLIALIGPHHWAHTYDIITSSHSGVLRASAFLARLQTPPRRPQHRRQRHQTMARQPAPQSRRPRRPQSPTPNLDPTQRAPQSRPHQHRGRRQDLLLRMV